MLAVTGELNRKFGGIPCRPENQYRSRASTTDGDGNFRAGVGAKPKAESTTSSQHLRNEAAWFDVPTVRGFQFAGAGIFHVNAGRLPLSRPKCLVCSTVRIRMHEP